MNICDNSIQIEHPQSKNYLKGCNIEPDSLSAFPSDDNTSQKKKTNRMYFTM